MMTRFSILVALGVMVGCVSQPVPDSGRGVGFGTATEFERQRIAREAALQGAPTTGAATTLQSPAQVTTQAIPSGDLAAVGIGQSQGGAPLTAMSPAGTSAVQAAPASSAPVAASNNVAISDENDFSAVSDRETIESDAERRARQAAQRREIAPTDLPARPTDAGPNIVEYALSAPNRKGQEWYSRSILRSEGRFQRNCASYNSPDAAQRDFLARGGPERDPRGIDPDGDGFACGWDPAPFLLAAGR